MMINDKCPKDLPGSSGECYRDPLPTAHYNITSEHIVGQKHDAGKAQWHLLPWRLIDEAVEVLTYGAGVYGAESWRSVPNGLERYFSAMMRHIRAFREGEQFDEESGKSHLAHALCDLIFQYELMEDKIKDENIKSSIQ